MNAQLLPGVAGAVSQDLDDAGLLIQSAAEIVPEAVEWLWQDNFALGKVAVVAGPAGGGKTLLIAGDFAARVSTGAPWPDGTLCPLGDVLIASGEDRTADTLVPRLVSHGADLNRVHFLAGFGVPCRGVAQRMFSLGDLPALDSALERRTQTRLVVIDPVSVFMGSVGGNDNARVRGMLAPLQDLAARRGVAFILISHVRKAAAANAAQAVIGSVGLVAAARVAWLLTRDAGDPDRRLFTVAKNNIGQDHFGYAWRLVDHRVTWEAQRLDLSGDRALADGGAASCNRVKQREDLAADFLVDFLKEGPRSWAAVERAGRAAGHKPMTLERARCRIAETFKRRGKKGRWLWRFIGDARTEPVPDADEMIGVDLDDLFSPVTYESAK